MPRPRRPGAPEPKRRSRNGCWPCKARKVKCDEEKPSCLNCQRQGESCDYSVRLNWGGRSKRASIDSSAPILKGSRGTPVDFHAVVRLNDVESRNCSAPAVAEKRAFKEAFINFKPGDFGSSEDASPNSNATFGAFDSPRPQTSSDIALSPSQGGNAFASALQRHSPGTPASVRPVNPRTLSQEIGGTASSPADQAVDFPSLSAFVFHSNSISQPLSFLRDVSDPPRHLAVSSGTDQDNQQQYAGRTGSHEERGLSFLLNDIDEPVGPFRELTDCRETPISAAAGSPSMANRGFDCGSTSSLARPSPFSTISIDDGGDTSNSRESVAAQNKWHAYLTSVTDNYGFDSGRPDRDLTLNNDHAAIDINSAVDKASPASQAPQCNGFPVARKPNYSEYYTSPVPINIPRCLSPLPPSLLRNPINLLYFHHFLDHTSKMLVPHDCDKNPFLSVLPSMAISDSNLLNLVLAYSASHRARYLGHPEPANRIAHWVRDVFPTLRMALDASKQDITDSHLATAILLLSLKIVSPTTFEVPITWQSHLKLARDLFMACSDRLARPGNQVGAFFARWLGYIDTMGALSCRQAGPPLMLYHHVLAESSRPKSHDENCVDCFTGFSPRTGLFLIRLAQLVQQCDNERFDDFGHFRRDWHPSADIVMEADALLGDFDDLGEVVHSDPTHHVGIQADDMMSTEEAFRCAGLLHLHRRVLESSPKSFPVQDALRRLLGALDRMRLGASTEVCSLLPLFTAGCESQDPSQRMRVLDRLFELEKSGLKQIQNARRLMQQCWEEDLPWIALADGQFLG